MRKVILFIATSLDGYIARPNGDIDWLTDGGGGDEDYGYKVFYDSIDTVLMGGKTYRQVKGFDGEWPYPTKQSFVFTHDVSYKNDDEVSFIHHDIPDFVKGLKEKPGKDIWLVGGNQLNTMLLANDLIDQILLFKQPVVLGSGIPLFSALIKDHFFKLKHVAEYESGMLKMVYDRLDQPNS